MQRLLRNCCNSKQAERFPATLVSLGKLPSFALKMETICFSETLVDYLPTNQHGVMTQNNNLVNLTIVRSSSFSCDDQQEIVWMNSVHETSFMQLVSSVYDSPC
jgi:hypothetical protein